MLSARLKEETALEHEALENEMMPLLRHATDLHSYARLLGGMQLFLVPLETAAHSFFTKDALPDLENRRNAGLLATDLSALNKAHLPAGNAVAFVPEITSLAQAWGAFYLLEGSTLGGQMITKMLRRQLPEAAQQLAYFEGYGAQTGSMWKTFKKHLDIFGEAQPAAQDAVVAYARGAFTGFQQALQAYKKTL